MDLIILGSSLTFSAQGGRGKEKNLPAEKIGSPSEGAAEGGCGGNSAAPERSAGAKRRRSVSLKIGSDFVKQTHQD